jgi:prepilin-type N-terminal cleavage/methylation domain-containing protein
MMMTPANRSQRHSTRRAFTLIELLVVIAIILILAGLVLFAGRIARERMLIARCKSELKALQLAVREYVKDNGGLPPNQPNWGPYLIQGKYIDWPASRIANGQLLDPWGHAYSFGVSGDAADLKDALNSMRQAFNIHSIGPDGKDLTGDDLDLGFGHYN